MRSWRRDFETEIRLIVVHFRDSLGGIFRARKAEHPYLLAGVLLAALVLVGGIVFAARTSTDTIAACLFGEPEHLALPDYTQPVREEPDSFRMNTYMPRRREKYVVGPLGRAAFLPQIDLVLIDDERVWWESDHDRGDTENDHVFHRNMEEPMRRLIELVNQHGGTLKVQDAYREKGVHAKLSFHKVGRAVDVTCDELGLEKLAKLAWAAGFDWVYYEAPKKGGHHVHASVKGK